MTAELAVLVGFLLFFMLVFYLGVPGMIGGMLDSRANKISTQLDEARLAREEAQKILSGIERRTRDVDQEAGEIVERANSDAKRSAEQSKIDLQNSIARKMKDADDRIAQAEASASREVRNSAASTAISAAREVLAEGASGSQGDALLDQGIATIGTRLK